jgi:hypothetical protein
LGDGSDRHAARPLPIASPILSNLPMPYVIDHMGTVKAANAPFNPPTAGGAS